VRVFWLARADPQSAALASGAGTDSYSERSEGDFSCVVRHCRASVKSLFVLVVVLPGLLGIAVLAFAALRANRLVTLLLAGLTGALLLATNSALLWWAAAIGDATGPSRTDYLYYKLAVFVSCISLITYVTFVFVKRRTEH
jgi:hypothetical protein